VHSPPCFGSRGWPPAGGWLRQQQKQAQQRAGGRRQALVVGSSQSVCICDAHRLSWLPFAAAGKTAAWNRLPLPPAPPPLSLPLTVVPSHQHVPAVRERQGTAVPLITGGVVQQLGVARTAAIYRGSPQKGLVTVRQAGSAAQEGWLAGWLARSLGRCLGYWQQPWLLAGLARLAGTAQLVRLAELARAGSARLTRSGSRGCGSQTQPRTCRGRWEQGRQ